MERREQLAFLCQELETTGSATTIDGGGESGARVLASTMPGEDGMMTAGHFYIEPMLDGTWSVHGRPFPRVAVVVSGSVSLPALALLARETLLEARHNFIASMDEDAAPLRLPPPAVRERKAHDLAVELIAGFVGGKQASKSISGVDVIGSEGAHQIQVRALVQSTKTGRVPELRPDSQLAESDYDELMRVEFSEYMYPMTVRAIEGGRVRQVIVDGTDPANGEAQDLPTFLHSRGYDITEAVRAYFDERYLLDTVDLQASAQSINDVDVLGSLTAEITLGKSKEQSKFRHLEGFDAKWDRLQAEIDEISDNNPNAVIWPVSDFP